MGVRRWRKLAMLFKLETTYGTDATPLPANAIIGKNVTHSPIEGQEVSRELLLPYMGHQGVVLTGLYSRVEFDMEIAGSGAAGTPPKGGPILRAAAMAETITATTKVDYTIVEDLVESGSLYFVMDKVQHVMLGCQVNVAPSLSPGGIPFFRVSVLGLLGTISDLVSMPAVSSAGWITPVPVSKANTQMTLHGWSATAESISLDLGNVLTPRFLIGDEKIMISDRQSVGTVVVEARLLAEVNWFDKALKRTRGTLLITHGTVAGNIVEFSAPAVEVGRPTPGQTNGIANYSIPLYLVPSVGLDEIKMTFR